MRSPLTLLAVVFAVSALMRLWETPAAFAAIGTAASRDPAATEALIADIEARRRMLDARESELDQAVAARRAALDARERRIAEAEAALRDGLEELEAARAELQSLVDRADGMADADLARLAEIYASMRPAEAGELFAVMEPGFAAGFLSMMPSEAAAGILAELPPELAYAISATAATRSAALGLGGGG